MVFVRASYLLKRLHWETVVSIIHGLYLKKKETCIIQRLFMIACPLMQGETCQYRNYPCSLPINSVLHNHNGEVFSDIAWLQSHIRFWHSSLKRNHWYICSEAKFVKINIGCEWSVKRFKILNPSNILTWSLSTVVLDSGKPKKRLWNFAIN